MMRIKTRLVEKRGGPWRGRRWPCRRVAARRGATWRACTLSVLFFTRWLEAEGHRRDSCRLNTMVTVYPHLRNALRERDNAVWRFSRLWFVARETRKEKLQGGSLPCRYRLSNVKSREFLYFARSSIRHPSLSLSLLSLSLFRLATRTCVSQGARETLRDPSASS